MGWELFFQSESWVDLYFSIPFSSNDVCNAVTPLTHFGVDTENPSTLHLWLWKTYQKILHALTTCFVSNEWPTPSLSLFSLLETKRQVFSPQTPASKTSNLRIRLALAFLEPPEFAGRIQGDNLVALVGFLVDFFETKAFPSNKIRCLWIYEWNKAFVWMDGKTFLFGWMLFINETKHLFGWMVHREAKHFCWRIWFWSLFWTATTSVVLLIYPIWFNCAPTKNKGCIVASVARVGMKFQFKLTYHL